MNFCRASFLLACIFFLSLATAEDQKPPKLPQWHGQRDGGVELSTKVLKTQPSWAAFWKGQGKPMPQELDEALELAVFISIGERPTGGFKPQIVSASEIDGKYVIVYSEGKPSPDSFVTQALTYPWVIAIVPKSVLKMETRLQAP
jgi:hypothetical protein